MAEPIPSSPRAIAVLTGIVEFEEDQYVAQCLELGTATQADTEDEAWANLQEAVQGEIEVLGEYGELERTFEERGIQIWPVGQGVVQYRDLSDIWKHYLENDQRNFFKNATPRIWCGTVPIKGESGYVEG